MLLHVILIGLFLAVLILSLVLARLNGERPITLALTAIPALAAIYAAATLLYRLVSGETDAATVYDQPGGVIYWLALIAILGYAIRMTRRIGKGRNFTGPDGRRWRVRTARVQGVGAVPVARPAARKPTRLLIE